MTFFKTLAIAILFTALVAMATAEIPSDLRMYALSFKIQDGTKFMGSFLDNFNGNAFEIATIEKKCVVGSFYPIRAAAAPTDAQLDDCDEKCVSSLAAKLQGTEYNVLFLSAESIMFPGTESGDCSPEMFQLTVSEDTLKLSGIKRVKNYEESCVIEGSEAPFYSLGCPTTEGQSCVACTQPKFTNNAKVASGLIAAMAIALALFL